VLRAKGANFYGWINPMEALQSTRSTLSPTEADPWIPCGQGGFVYLFGEAITDADPRDVVFAITSAPAFTPQTPPAPFPTALGPFRLTPATRFPPLSIDFRQRKWSLPRIELGTRYSAQIRMLQNVLPALIQGAICTPYEILLPPASRREQMVPPDATHVVWCYHGLSHDALMSASPRLCQRLPSGGLPDMDSAEMCFVQMGGFA
jgi:hypothetical protein